MTIPWLPLFPDGSQPVTEVLGYPTSILTSASGREQRIRLREYPSREFTMRMVEMEARETSRLLYALEQGHDFNAYVPFWPEAFQLTADHVATDVTLNVDRTTERIQWFGQYSQALLWRGEGTHARYTFIAEAAGTVDVDPPLAESWAIGSWVVPLWPCKIVAVGKIDRATDTAVVLESLTARLDWGLGRRNPIRERLYWRAIAPGDLHTGSLGATFYGDFWGVVRPQVTPWVTPTLANVEANQGTLHPTKGIFSGATTSTSTSVDESKDYSGIQLRFVGAALAAQTVPKFLYKIAFRAQAPSGGVTGYAHMRIGYFRPSTNTVLAVYEDLLDTSLNRYFRFTPLEHIARIWVPNELVIQDGDRVFLDVVTNVDCAGGISTTNGQGVILNYNGDNEDFVSGRFSAVHQSASYVEIPKLVYLDRDPAVPYP